MMRKAVHSREKTLLLFREAFNRSVAAGLIGART
jgi:hypothetical protein